MNEVSPAWPSNGARLFAIIMLLLFLAGCGSSTVESNLDVQENLPTPTSGLLTSVSEVSLPLTTQPQPLAKTATATVTRRPRATVTALPTATPSPTATPVPRIASPLATPDSVATLVNLLSTTVTLSITEPLLMPVMVDATPWITATALVAIMPPLDASENSEDEATTATLTPTPIVLPTPTPTLEPTPDGDLRTARVPILMYHYLSVPPEGADRYRLDLSVAPDLFAAHLDRIQAEGYTTISFYELVAHLTQGAPLPDKPIILTFDDGYRDNYENAFPLLVEHQMRATFFVVTDFIDEARPEYLAWDMAREMLAAGMSIESHSRNHATLRKRDNDYLIWQILGSLETLEYELGVRPRFISYPAGEYDQATIDIAHSANYWAGITTEQGVVQRSDELFELQRVRIRGTTTPDDLAALLSAEW